MHVSSGTVLQTAPYQSVIIESTCSSTVCSPVVMRISREIVRSISQQLSSLAEQHIVFEWLRLDYAERFKELRNAEKLNYQEVHFNTSMHFMLNRFTDAQKKLR